MDFEAPPPLAGALEEPPDLECDSRLTVDDEDDSLRELEIPTDLPCTSSTACTPIPSPCPIKQKSPELKSSSHSEAPADQGAVHCTNGVVDDEEDVSTASDFCPDAVDKEEVDAVDNQEDRSQGDTIDDEDDFGDFAGIDADVSLAEEAGSSNDLPPKESSPEISGEPNRCSPVRRPVHQSPSRVNSQGVEPEEWNAFNTAKDCENEGWSADFEAFGDASHGEEVAGRAPVPEDGIFPGSVPSPILDELCDSMDLWNVDSEIGLDEAYDISKMLDSDASSKKEVDPSFERSFDLWLALRIVEDALALKFEWKGSEHGSNLFKTLRVDPSAVGRGSLPPLSTTTVLEPIPFTANGTTRRSVIISREEGAYGAKIVASDVSTNALPTMNCTAVNAESPSIPQADFDWDASDLKNPTKAANRSSALLDVDFLSANSGGGSSSTISTLQKELDQLGLSATEPPTLRKPASQPTMLDMLMASATNTSKRNNRQPSELSLDARALHDQLPDLEFLRANMIMFPLGGSRSNET
nr:Protein Y45G5AM.9, isoform b [Haemonchus contortus]